MVPETELSPIAHSDSCVVAIRDDATDTRPQSSVVPNLTPGHDATTTVTQMFPGLQNPVSYISNSTRHYLVPHAQALAVRLGRAVSFVCTHKICVHGVPYAMFSVGIMFLYRRIEILEHQVQSLLEDVN